MSSFDVSSLSLTLKVLLYLTSAAVLYAALIFLGRLLKRRAGVQLNWVYHVFAIAAAFYVPAAMHKGNEPGEREMLATLVIASAFVLIAFLRRYIWESWASRLGDSKMPKFLSEFFSILIVAVAVLIVLRVSYKVNLDAVVAGSGIVAIIVGLALQDLLGNLFSGFAIYFGGQFKAGDWLLIEDTHAEIMEINWRSTRLRTEDHVTLDIPNSNITKEKVVNFNYPTSLHAMRFEIGLEYDAPPSLVKQVLVSTALEVEHILREPAPEAFLKNFGDYSVAYEVQFWINDHSRHLHIMSDLRTSLWYALKRNGLSIPFPIQWEYGGDIPGPPPRPEGIIRQALEKVFFAESLSRAELDRLVGSARFVVFGAKERLMEQGAEGSSMLILVGGRAEVAVEQDGRRKIVATLGVGDCLGEMSLLTGEPRSATVVALTDCRAVELSKDHLAAIISANPALLRRLSELLAERRTGLQGAKASLTVVEQQTHANAQAGFLEKLKNFFEI